MSGPANSISLGVADDENTAALYFSMAAGEGPVANPWELDATTWPQR